MSINLVVEDTGGGELFSQILHTKSIERPPLPRNETNLSGLQNQGGTCYLNVLIQTLLFTPEFREPLFQLTPKDLNLSTNENDQNSALSIGNSLKVRKIIVELQRLFAEMLLLNQQACSSIRLTDSFGWQSNETIDHQDVHELNRLLFDAIHKSLQGTQQSNLIRFCYEGSTVNYTECKSCQRIFKRMEDYHDLPLVVQDSPNLQTSLANMFTIHEQLIGDNQYRCSSCSNKLCDAEKWAKISKLPPILTLPLQRFVYDTKTGSRQKNTTRFEFPFEIDLKEFCEDSVAETNYELLAVVIHKGTCYLGHYYGYIKDIDQIGTWIKPTAIATKSTNKQKSSTSENDNPSNNDSSNNRNTHESKETVDTQAEAMKKLDLIKTLLLSCDDWVTIEDLLASYRENTKLSWGRTRGVHGSFTKFLRSHPKIFEVNDKHVRLIDRNCPMDVDDNDFDSMDYQSSQTEDLIHENTDDEHWFCFDDSIVTCVTREHIRKHYGQNDCAYMLFYRQKSRNRLPMNRSDDNFYAIPQWLFDEISEKNKILDDRRTIYQRQHNQLPITFYPSEWFQVTDDGRLTFNNTQVLFPDLYGEHVVDKRTKINDFLAKLEDVFGMGSHFYVAKKLCSGQLHVITELAVSSNDEVLDKSDLANYRHLIVYKSPSSLPDVVLQGEEFEPIMLNIVYGFPDAKTHEGHIQAIRHVSKNTTLLELKQILCHEYYGYHDDQKLRQTRLGKLNLEEKNSRKSRREFKADEEKQTLAQLHLQDGDTLGIDDKNSVVPNWKNVSSNSANNSKNQLSLTVKNLIATDSIRPMTYSCFNTTPIGEVKLMALQAFALSIDPSMCRLHVEHQDIAHIPLYDHQTVDSIDFKQNNTNLCLKFGQALKENDILLYVLSEYDPSPLELVVDQNITLSHLWLIIRKELNMEDGESEYHLCEMTSSLTDEAEPLNDFDQTLLVNGLTNGSQMIMKSGSVAKRNHVRLKISRIMGKIYTPNPAIHTRPEYDMIEFDDWIELPITSTFNSLRQCIATQIENKVPSGYSRDVKAFDFIRLYRMEEDQSLSIVHEPALTTLKQAKVQDLDSYAFELLSHPETLAKKDLLLNVVYSKDEDEDYFQYQFELHWPLKENIVAKYEYLEHHILTHLSAFIANQLHFKNVSKDALKLTLARYFPDRAQWIVIDSSSSNTGQSSNKKNKTANSPTKTSKANLRLEPYKINDLAVIGVLEGENLTVDHFDTSYDRQKRELIKHDEAQKRSGRQLNRKDDDQNSNKASSERRKSPQNMMRITVDDFET